MSDRRGISPEGFKYFAEEVEERTEPKKMYPFNGTYISVTRFKPNILNKEKFYRRLKLQLPSRTRIFGGREQLADGGHLYHAVVAFADNQHRPDVVRMFALDGDTKAIRLVEPKPGQKFRDFLESWMENCSKDGDTYGRRISLKEADGEERKRKWQAIVDEPYEDVASRMIQEVEPRVSRSTNVKDFLSTKKAKLPT